MYATSTTHTSFPGDTQNLLRFLIFFRYLINDDIGGGARKQQDTDVDRGGKGGITFLAPGEATRVQFNSKCIIINITVSIIVWSNTQD